MEISEIYDALKRPLPKVAGHILFTGLYASSRAIVLSQMREHTILAILDSQDEAQYLYSDLKALGANALYFPTSHRRRQGTDEAMAIQRTEVLSTLLQPHQENHIIVTYPEALAEETPLPDELNRNTITLHQDESVGLTGLIETLLELGFERVDFVYEPGQFAVRGGIIDIYSYSHDDPYRIDFFGNQIDSIRTFDIETQLSDKRVNTIDIVGNQESASESQQTASLLHYLPKQTYWVSNDWSVVNYKIDSLEFRVNNQHLSQYLETIDTIEIAAKSYFTSYSKIEFNTLPQPIFHKNFELLQQDIDAKIQDGYRVYICAEQKKQLDRLEAILETAFTPVQGTLHAGFVDNDLKICCYTDHEIFERYHRVTLRSENARRGKAVITLKEINQLQLGDYVVHSDHGIGQFGGLVTTTVNGKRQEMIKLTYRDGDTIFVSIHNLHRISKYKGKEGSAPTISKIGSGAWERIKERTKDKVKDIARDLIRLYATRKQQKGFAYTPDGYMQHELEASFLYEDTPDQAKATIDVKRDMESPMPMDRLICGDVGFGKTEIAMRAAFKAATDGKQVAVLVPTTVLALQHYTSFKERFKNFPVRVEYLSRGKSQQQVKEILSDLETGKIDILIGTHKLVGKTVKWHDLGLLIIDEEQKFGVAVKDKLKAFRTNVDVLTLTATPIPRTLQFSLLGARDLSVMTTPPPNRYPVQTEVIGIEDEDIIKEAIDIEMERNGQVFVVNNRIDMLPRIENRIRRLCPEARIVVAHGQMPTEEMEQRLEDFINYDYDVLISTTIIESGVDIPNVNTMIIYSAQHYGLADLHQLRGRVGRSNRKAYCYLVTPERELLTPDARRRLDAISTFAELGSGFNLAMQDLDIRGAGNMLGAEQSGFIAELGYETYQRILNEAVEELKGEILGVSQDTSELEQTSLGGLANMGSQNWCSDSQLESDLSLCFPQDYIENISERITLYKELDSLRNEEELTEYKKRLIDRFGPLPEAAEDLTNVVRLRWICCRMGIEKIFLKGERMSIFFMTTNDAYWQSEIFGKILDFAYQRPQKCQFHEPVDKQGHKTGKRYLTIDHVKTLAGAIHLLSKIEE
ncbi:MAG: transcription-repair coupling factor [Paludibacteraceae bacterium]|nr:transcription-repair coupling factor [Paludibacteraceae bacterium]